MLPGPLFNAQFLPKFPYAREVGLAAAVFCASCIAAPLTSAALQATHLDLTPPRTGQQHDLGLRLDDPILKVLATATQLTADLLAAFTAQSPAQQVIANAATSAHGAADSLATVPGSSEAENAAHRGIDGLASEAERIWL